MYRKELCVMAAKVSVAGRNRKCLWDKGCMLRYGEKDTHGAGLRGVRAWGGAG